MNFIFIGSMTQRTSVRDSLLICYQTLRGHYGSAISHAENGVKVIFSPEESISPQASQSPSLLPSPVPCVLLETLKVVFARLDHQSNQVIALPLQCYAWPMY